MSSVVGIYISAEKEQTPTSVPMARAIAHRGLEGDRYFHKRGSFSDDPPFGPGRELTLIAQEALEQLKQEYEIDLDPAEARRNIVTSGLRLDDLIEREFLIGEVRVKAIRPCPPCDHLKQLTGQNILRGLAHSGGLRLDILSDGEIHVGDTITVSDEA